MKYRVNEIFNSLQGEGFHAGVNCTFIRMSGCNLSCPFCDTAHQRGVMMTSAEILEECGKYKTRTVILTGGEPTLKPIGELVVALHMKGYYVCMETNGTRQVPVNVDWVTCSPKFQYCEGAQVVTSRIDELKVLFAADGYDYEKYLEIKADRYYLQPLDTGNQTKNDEIIAELIEYIQQHPIWRLSLQTQKIIGIR